MTHRRLAPWPSPYFYIHLSNEILCLILIRLVGWCHYILCLLLVKLVVYVFKVMLVLSGNVIKKLEYLFVKYCLFINLNYFSYDNSSTNVFGHAHFWLQNKHVDFVYMVVFANGVSQKNYDFFSRLNIFLFA